MFPSAFKLRTPPPSGTSWTFILVSAMAQAPESGGGHEDTKGSSHLSYRPCSLPEGVFFPPGIPTPTSRRDVLGVGLLAINSGVPRWQSDNFLNLATSTSNRTRMCDGVSDARASSPPDPSHFWKNQRPFKLSTSTIPASSDESSSGSRISCFRIIPHRQCQRPRHPT